MSLFTPSFGKVDDTLGYSPQFSAFAKAYPQGRIDSLDSLYRMWRGNGLDQQADKVMAALTWHKKYNRGWAAGYIHSARKFISEGMYKDHIVLGDDRKAKSGMGIREHLAKTYPEHADELATCSDDRVNEMDIFLRWRKMRAMYGDVPNTIYQWLEWQKQRHVMGLRGPVSDTEKPE